MKPLSGAGAGECCCRWVVLKDPGGWSGMERALAIGFAYRGSRRLWYGMGFAYSKANARIQKKKKIYFAIDHKKMLTREKNCGEFTLSQAIPLPTNSIKDKQMSTKTTTKAAKTTTKAAGNTPAKKAEGKAAVKPQVFALVAGMVRKLEHKGLKQAIKYHVSKGNLKLTEQGIALTEQGAMLWAKERQAIDPAKFQEIAAFINGAECPKEWKGQPVVKLSDTMQFPCMLYWGSFSSGIMRQAFAALWAK